MERYFYDVDRIKIVKHGNIFDGHLTYNFNGFQRLITIYLHSPYEVMNIARSMGTTPDTLEFEVFSTEMLAESFLQTNTWVIQRKCRFHNESNLLHFPIYTKKLCLAECRWKLMMEKCGCIPHFIPNRGIYGMKLELFRLFFLLYIFSSREAEKSMFVARA